MIGLCSAIKTTKGDRNMDKLKGKKLLYIGVPVILLAGLLLWGARAYFFAPSLSSASFEWLAEPQYRLANDFSCGVAWVEVKDKVWRQIDTQGNILIDNYEAGHISRYDKETGLASFKDINYNAGYINLSGDVVISPEYTLVNDFQHGMAPIAKKIDRRKWEYRYGVIDRRGKMILPAVYESIRPLTPHVFAVEKTGRKTTGDPYNGAKWMYVNEKGEPISDQIFEFKDLDGNPQTPGSTFHTTLPPNLCLTGVDGKVGLINDKGEWVLPASYDMIYPATQEPIGVLKDGKVGFIDLKGNTVIDFQFGEWNWSIAPGAYYQFSEGLAVVVLPGSTPQKGEIPKSGVINEKGELLFTLPGMAKGVCVDGFVVVRTKDKVEGLVDRKGNWYPLPPYLMIWTNRVSDRILRVVEQKSDGKNIKIGKMGYIKVKVKRNQTNN